MAINYSDYCNRFCEIESEYYLFELKFNNIRYWKYARFYLNSVLKSKLFGSELEAWIDGKNKEQCRLPKYSKMYQRVTDKIFHNPVIGCKNKDVLLFSFGRRVKDGKKYVCPVTDEISLHLDRSHCTVETPYFWGYYRPPLIRDLKYFDVWEGVGKKSNEYVSMSLEELEARLFHIFEAEFAVAFTDQEKEILCTNINYYVMYRDELLENYKKLLYYIRPKVVLYAESFTGEKVVLTEALKEIKIPCIEILHGYMTDNTVEYNYLETGINNALPDYIFTYSQVQKDIIRWGIPKDHVRVVGHPWLEKRKRELLQCNFDKNKSKKVVTFISNANLSIIKYLTFVADLLDPDKYELKLKLHPTEIQENYQDLPDSIEIIYGNRADVQDIHYYLAKSDIVVGIASTALYEAAIYPVEIFVLQESEFEIMNLMLESERATLVNSPEQLYEFVISESRQKSSESMNFFATNAIDHINKQINMIIEETKKVC